MGFKNAKNSKNTEINTKNTGNNHKNTENDTKNTKKCEKIGPEMPLLTEKTIPRIFRALVRGIGAKKCLFYIRF
jgi:hypothetical protein